jgi:hypothetical protein
MSEHAIDQRPKRGMRSTIHQEGLRLNGDRRFDRNALGLLVGSRFWMGAARASPADSHGTNSSTAIDQNRNPKERKVRPLHPASFVDRGSADLAPIYSHSLNRLSIAEAISDGTAVARDRSTAQALDRRRALSAFNGHPSLPNSNGIPAPAKQLALFREARG